MNIILVNLTRFGDLLQSQAAIRALVRMESGEATRSPGRAASCRQEGGIALSRAERDGCEPRFTRGEATSATASAPTGSRGRAASVCLISLANFAPTSALLDGVTLTKPLPRGGFMEKLGGLASDATRPADWALALAELWQWREDLWRDFKPDLICNLTPTVPARLLARYLAEKNACALSGFGIDAFGFSQNTPWGNFLQGAAGKRSQSPFNVVDLFRAVAGSTHAVPGDAALRPQEAASVEAMRQKFTDELADTAAACRGFVAFQLGASEEKRQWPLEYFVWLGHRLWSELRLVPVLLGSGGESELGRRYGELNQMRVETNSPAVFPHLSLIGRTNLAELSAALSVCSLLVSNDTGTLHLAAGLGRPVLGIFLATAQPWDTGPSLPGSLCLEPDLPCHPCAFGVSCPHALRCRKALRPETVWRLAHAFLTRGRWPESALPQTATDNIAKASSTLSIPENGLPQTITESVANVPQISAGGARVWLTGCDDFGFLCLKSLSGHIDSPRTRWFMEQRDFLRQFLDRDPLKEFSYQPPAGSFLFPTAEREKLAAELEQARAQIGLLLEQGALLQRNPLPVLRERFLASVLRITQTFEQSEYLGVLNYLWNTEVQEQGGDLPSALRCAGQYHSLCAGLLERVTS